MSPTLRRRKDPAPAGNTAQTAPQGSSEGSARDSAQGSAAPVATAPEPPRPQPRTQPRTQSRTQPRTESRPEPRAESRRRLAHSTAVLLVRAAHPRQAALTAGGLAIAAALTGRSGREVLLVLGTVLVGQTILGWHNDLVDRTRDATRLPSGKPIADGYLDPGTVWFALVCAVLLVVPLAVQNGVSAGAAYLASIAVGMVGNVVLRRGWLSWVPWAVAYGLYPYFLSYGGWGGDATGTPPQVAIVVLAAALGIGVHVLCALPGLVADHEDGLRHLPLRIALRTGATRLLVLALAWTVLAMVGLLVVGNSGGLGR